MENSFFKGEQELNIFNKADALSYLVETFSQVKNFDPYISFMDKAKVLSETATDNAMKADKKNTKKATELRGLIKIEEDTLRSLRTELKDKQTEAANFQSLLENLEQNKEASSLLVNTNERLKSLEQQKKDAEAAISEEYNYRLLDEMWILMGFVPIAGEYRTLVAALDKEKRTIRYSELLSPLVRRLRTHSPTASYSQSDYFVLPAYSALAIRHVLPKDE